MTDNLDFIRDLFKKSDVILPKGDVWAVQGTPVVKHRALERLAAALRIRFDAPQILRAERDEAVILASAKIGEISEWSIGEACVNVNYRVTGKMAAYVYAMAEKRARDRVILKLAGLHGVYSEEEDDEFKGQDAKHEDTRPSLMERCEAVEKAMLSKDTPEALTELWHRLEDDMKEKFRARFAKLGAELKAKAAPPPPQGKATFESGRQAGAAR